MRIAVRYQSKGGSTRKVAEAIAHKAGVVAKALDPQEKLSGIDLLFVGGGTYAGKPDKVVTDALSTLTKAQAGCVALFYTSMAPQTKVGDLAKAALKDASVQICGEVYHCPGKFLFFHGKRPNATDLAGAEAFAKRTVEARRKSIEK